MALRAPLYGITPAMTNILFVGFNEDARYLCVGTTTGFEVYNCSPFTRLLTRTFCGGVGIVEMLRDSNIFALVGGGPHACFHPTKVIVWNEKDARILGEVPLPSEVKGVRLRKDRLVIAAENLVYIWSMNLECLRSYETSANPHGLMALSVGDEAVLAHPGQMSGQVAVQNLHSGSSFIITAHHNPLGMLATNYDGTLLASTSVNGTVIKVHDVPLQKTIKEVRRGSTAATVYCVCFSPSGRFLACVADSGTIHIFTLVSDGQNGSPNGESSGVGPNRKSRFAFFGNVVAPSLLDSEWSFAWYGCPSVPAILAFGAEEDNQLYVATYDGTFLLLAFDRQNGGECTCQKRHAFTPKDPVG